MVTTHTPESLSSLARGFMESRVFLTAAELDLFTLLADGPLSLEEAAGARGADRRALAILLDALTAMGLLEKADGRWRTPEALVPLLSSRSGRSLLPLALHSVNLWDRWSRLTETVAGARPVAGDGWTRSFIGAMHAIAAPQADAIVAAVGPGSARRLLDVGGGPATYTLAFLRAALGWLLGRGEAETALALAVGVTLLVYVTALPAPVPMPEAIVQKINAAANAALKNPQKNLRFWRSCCRPELLPSWEKWIRNWRKR